jgi:hypothetical protein
VGVNTEDQAQNRPIFVQDTCFDTGKEEKTAFFGPKN